jgi:hypothetical protein
MGISASATGTGRHPQRSSTWTARGLRLWPVPSERPDPSRRGDRCSSTRYLPREPAAQPAQRVDAPDRDAPRPDGWHELAVANPTFLLERVGSECTDLRELTVDGLDTIAALADASGRVVWDMDWLRFDASGGRVRKVSVIDTGTAMTAEQLRCYINQLASSGREQSAGGTVGVGAKLAAGSRNPHGLGYRSWHPGQGSLACFKRHPDGRWGLQPHRSQNGHTDFWRPLTEQDKPSLPRGQDHGTLVVLLGRHARLDTTQAPGSVSEAPRRWITRYLNARFLRLPAQVEVIVREHYGRDERGHLEHVHGAQHHLERRAVAARAVDLSDAIARWRVLDDDHRGRHREAGLWTSSGHVAAVFADELYDVLAQTRGGYGRLQDLAIRFAYERVTLHVEPQVNSGRLDSNTARTLLVLDHEPLPWSRWGETFAAAMPEEILRLQERAASTDGVPRQDAIRNRVSAILPLYRLSRYRPTPQQRGPSVLQFTGSRTEKPGSTRIPTTAAPSSEPAAPPVHASSNGELARSMADSGSPARNGRHEALPPRTVNLPDVAWISARDGTRAPRDLEDLAARYHPGRHELTINSDFRAISDLIAHWCQRYRGAPGARTIIEGQVPRMVRTDPRRGHTRRPQLCLEPRATRRAPLTHLVHRGPAPAPTTPRHAPEAPSPEAGPTASPRRVTERGCGIAAARSHQVGESRPGRTPRAATGERPVSRSTPARGRQLAAELEQRFARDAELARALNDAHKRLHVASDRLWSGLHPDGAPDSRTSSKGSTPGVGSTPVTCASRCRPLRGLPLEDRRGVR